jgi:hypothetical protein
LFTAFDYNTVVSDFTCRGLQYDSSDNHEG